VWQRRRPSGDSKPYLSPQQKKLLRRFAKGKQTKKSPKSLAAALISLTQAEVFSFGAELQANPKLRSGSAHDVI
jgi:hypothetical protein